MLVEFRVQNFRSLRDEQLLSMVASKDKTMLETNAVGTGLSAVPHVLKSSVIYGANASGKSNLIKALQYMRDVVLQSAAIPPGQLFNVKPFLLDEDSAASPVEFEVTFLLGKIRYQYGFTMNAERILSEYLLVYKAFKPQRWFERRFDDETGQDSYEFGSGLKGTKQVWEKATRSNALFLSMAVQLNSEGLRPVYDWFAKKLVIFNEQEQLNSRFTVQMLKQPDSRKQICDFLQAADISISDIDVQTRKVPGQALHVDMVAGKTELKSEQVEQHQLLFSHVTEQGKAVFELADESSGTRNLLFLAGPVLDILQKGCVLVVDELDTSLHSLLVHELVRLFHRNEINQGDAQLIFSTHDTSLLGAPDLLRRDQIWLVEKDVQQASMLVALSEFSPRKNEALERGYLMGRYGGIPFVHERIGGGLDGT